MGDVGDEQLRCFRHVTILADEVSVAPDGTLPTKATPLNLPIGDQRRVETEGSMSPKWRAALKQGCQQYQSLGRRAALTTCGVRVFHGFATYDLSGAEGTR
jgi:hypothetical protein